MNRIVLFTVFYAISTLSYAQDNQENPKGFFSAGINPFYPFLGGYGVKAFYNFPSKWSVGLASEGNLELPEFIAEHSFKNGKNITVDWDYSIGIEARYRFRKKDNDIKGLYAMGSLGYEGLTFTKQKDATVIPNTLQEEKFTNWYSNLGFGYNLFPFKRSGFWIGVQYKVIFNLSSTNERNVNGVNYSMHSVVPPSLIPGLYIGWRFK